MTPPENDQPDDDGGTFKLKPGGATPPPAAPQEDNLDRTMKIQRSDPPQGTPPPPPSPLGNPTGPADPPPATYAETTVMPQQGGSQTGYQPSQQQTPPPNPLGAPPVPPQAPGQQPYGQQPPGGYPPPPQPQPGYGQPQQAPGPQGEVPEGIKRIGLIALIGAGIGLLNAIALIVLLGPFGIGAALFVLLFAGAFGWYGWALPKGKITAAGLRLTGIILMMIGAGGSALSTISSLITADFVSMILYLLLAAAYGYASFLYIKDEQVKAYIKGAPKHPGYPQQGAHPGQQPYGQPQQQYGQPGPGQPGFPPPPPGYPQQGQQPPQAPYGR